MSPPPALLFFEYSSALLQSIANLPPSGESLKILAQDLGNRVYTKYVVRQKHQNKILEKLSNIYNAYTELLAKDTKVNKSLCRISALTCLTVCSQHIKMFLFMCRPLHAHMYSNTL